MELEVATREITRSMNRSATEPVQQCLFRLATSLQKGKGAPHLPVTNTPCECDSAVLPDPRDTLKRARGGSVRG